MKLKTAGILTSATIIFGGLSGANAGTLIDMYAGVGMGAGASTLYLHNKNHTESAQSVSGFIGFDIPVLRLEAEYDYLRDNDITSSIAMLNAYLKMPTAVVKPYIGGGAGIVFDGKIENAAVNAPRDNAVAYQAMLGLTFDIPVLPLKFDVEGRAIYIPNIYAYENIAPELLHYEARAKLRYVF